jgi:hypothetical protein
MRGKGTELGEGERAFLSLLGLLRFQEYYVWEYYADLGFELGLLHSGISRSGLLRSG